MGILDSIGKPLNNPFAAEKQSAGEAETFFGDVVSETRRQAAPARSLFFDRLRDLEGGRVGARKRAVDKGVTGIAQQFGGAIQGQSIRGGDDIGAALTRARGIFKIAGATNRDFDAQLLNQRVGAAKQGIVRQGAGRALIGRAKGIRDEVANVNRNINEDLSGLRSGVAGGVAGIAIGAFEPQVRGFFDRQGESAGARAAIRNDVDRFQTL